jgi:hypothetical protein
VAAPGGVRVASTLMAGTPLSAVAPATTLMVRMHPSVVARGGVRVASTLMARMPPSVVPPDRALDSTSTTTTPSAVARISLTTWVPMWQRTSTAHVATGASQAAATR